jgi:hypothetical protein
MCEQLGEFRTKLPYRSVVAGAGTPVNELHDVPWHCVMNAQPCCRLAKSAYSSRSVHHHPPLHTCSGGCFTITVKIHYSWSVSDLLESSNALPA